MQYQTPDSATAPSAPLNPFRSAAGSGPYYSPAASPAAAWPPTGASPNGTQAPIAAAGGGGGGGAGAQVSGSVAARTPLQALQAKFDSLDRRQLVLIIVFIAIFLDNMLLTTVGAYCAVQCSAVQFIQVK